MKIYFNDFRYNYIALFYSDEGRGGGRFGLDQNRKNNNDTWLLNIFLCICNYIKLKVHGNLRIVGGYLFINRREFERCSMNSINSEMNLKGKKV